MTKAERGIIWVCTACGKRSNDRMGDRRIDHGWDESCYMHAILCYAEKNEDGKFVPVPEDADEADQNLSREPVRDQ